MAQIHDRRHQDYCPIDFDFYRKQAAALRSQARRDTFKSSATIGFVTISLAAIFMAALLTSMQFQSIQSAWI